MVCVSVRACVRVCTCVPAAGSDGAGLPWAAGRQHKPRRAHQGWRYLEAVDAPADLGEGGGGDLLPGHIAGELARLGLI